MLPRYGAAAVVENGLHASAPMSSVHAHHAANHGTTRMKTLEVDSTVEGQHEHRHVRVVYATSACISLKIIGRFVEFMSTRFVVSIAG